MLTSGTAARGSTSTAEVDRNASSRAESPARSASFAEGTAAASASTEGAAGAGVGGGTATTGAGWSRRSRNSRIATRIGRVTRQEVEET